MDASLEMYEKLEVLEMYSVRECKRKKRAAPRVCTARVFRNYKLEICYVYIISRAARKTRADLSFSYLHALRLRHVGCGTSAVEPNGSAALRAAFKANK